MKNKLAVALLAALSVFLALPVFAQSTINFTQQNSFAGGEFYAPAYNYQTSVYGGGGTSGAYSITVFKPSITLRDGRVVYPFSTTAPITIGQGSAKETVTPSSVANCSGINPAGTYCTITATFSNAHGKGDIIVSGDNGIQEAISDARRNGGGNVWFRQDCGIVTLSTSSATTTASCKIPSTYVTVGFSVYVTTTITTSASYDIGTSDDTDSFNTPAACTSLTAGTTCAAFNTAPLRVDGTGTFTGLNAVLITANATAGAGAVHLTVWGYVQVPANF